MLLGAGGRYAGGRNILSADLVDCQNNDLAAVPALGPKEVPSAKLGISSSFDDAPGKVIDSNLESTTGKFGGNRPFEARRREHGFDRCLAFPEL
jgi:hypothetical protein